MRQLLVLLLCLLAACATAPVRPTARPAELAQLPGFPSLAPRIGIEYLAAAAGAPAPAPALEGVASERPVRPSGREAARTPRHRRQPAAEPHTWTLDTDELADLDSGMARHTLLLLEDLVGEDSRRIRRTLGTPVFRAQTIDLQSPNLDLPCEAARTEETAEWLSTNGVRLFDKPLQRLLRRTPLVRTFEDGLHAWRGDNVPLTDEYSANHQGGGNLGRISVRLHARDLQDPVELVWMRGWLRLGSSQEHCKVGVHTRLLTDLWLDLRTRHDYDDTTWPVRADLTWQCSESTQFHLAVGDDLDFVTPATLYSRQESTMNGTPGVMLYAVHFF